MSFARNFAAGQQIAQSALDTFNTARRNRDLGRVDDWKKSEEFEGFTQQDGAQMEAIANAKDAQGNPYYKMQDDGRGGLQVRSNFEYAGSDGNMVAPGATVGLAPRRVAEFGGQRYDASELTDQRMEALQDRERAKIMGRYNPELGIQMRRQMTQDEREGKRFGWEEQQQPLKQRAAELQVEGSERDNRQGVRAEGFQGVQDRVAKMPLQEVKALAAQLNGNESQYPLLYTGTDKNGYKFMSIDPETKEPGKEFVFNEAQLRQLATAALGGQEGFGAESLQLLSSVSKDLAAHIQGINAVTTSVVESQNNAFGRGRDDYFKQQELKLRTRDVDNRGTALNRPNFQQIGVDSNNEPVWADMNRVDVDPQGRLKLPEGVRGLRMPQTLSDAEKVAYSEAVKAISNLPPDAPAGAAAAIYKRFGLDPEKFTGSSGLPTSPRFGGGTQPSPAAGAPAAAPAPAPAPARPLSAFEQRRQQALEQEATRRAQEQAAQRAALEAERQQLLQQRPDLQGLGGMRFFQ